MLHTPRSFALLQSPTLNKATHHKKEKQLPAGKKLLLLFFYDARVKIPFDSNLIL